MSNKRNKYAGSSFGRTVPKAKVEVHRDEHGRVMFTHKVDHVKGKGVYHPTKGWRKVRGYQPHILLDELLRRIGITLYPNLR